MSAAASGTSGDVASPLPVYSTNQWTQHASTVPVQLALLTEETRCSICYGRIRKARVSMGCLHRYCTVCIEQSLRTEGQTRRADRTEKQQCPVCPVCRYPLPSRRATRPDPNFDIIISALYGDVDVFNEEEDRLVAEANKAVIAEQQRKMAQLRTSILQKPKPKVGRPRSTATPPPAEPLSTTPPPSMPWPWSTLSSSGAPAQQLLNGLTPQAPSAPAARALPYNMVPPMLPSQRLAPVVHTVPIARTQNRGLMQPPAARLTPHGNAGNPDKPSPAKKPRIGTLQHSSTGTPPITMQGTPSVQPKSTDALAIVHGNAAGHKAVGSAALNPVGGANGFTAGQNPQDGVAELEAGPDAVAVCFVPVAGTGSSTALARPYFVCPAHTTLKDMALVISDQLQASRGCQVNANSVQLFLHGATHQASEGCQPPMALSMSTTLQQLSDQRKSPLVVEFMTVGILKADSRPR